MQMCKYADVQMNVQKKCADVRICGCADVNKIREEKNYKNSLQTINIVIPLPNYKNSLRCILKN